jgi:hypothetical protein
MDETITDNNGTANIVPTPLQRMHPAVAQALTNALIANMPIGVTFVLLITDGQNTLTASPMTRDNIQKYLGTVQVVEQSPLQVQ